MNISRRIAGARAASVSRKLREDGFGPVRADERKSTQGIRVKADTVWGGVKVEVDFNGGHTRRSMTKLVHEALVELGYKADAPVEFLLHSREEIEQGRDFHGVTQFYAWLPGWGCEREQQEAFAAAA